MLEWFQTNNMIGIKDLSLEEYKTAIYLSKVLNTLSKVSTNITNMQLNQMVQYKILKILYSFKILEKLLDH